MSKPAATWIISANDEAKEEGASADYNTSQKIQAFAIANRGKFMGLPDAIGLSTTKVDNEQVIVLRVPKGHKGWSETPNWLKEAKNGPNNDDKYFDKYYNIMDEKSGKELMIDNKPVFLGLEGGDASINVDSLKAAVNNIGSTKKNSFSNYTKAQNYFLDFVSFNDKVNDADKAIKKLAFDLRKKLMGLNNIVGITVGQYDNTDAMTIIAKVGKQYKEWDTLPDFLIKTEKNLNLNDSNVKGCFLILNENKEVLLIDNKEVYLIARFEENKVDSLNPASNNIGATKKNSFQNYTKAQTYFLDFVGSDDKGNDQNKAIKKLAFDLRKKLMGLNNIIGITVGQYDDIDVLTIVGKVGRQYKEWTELPDFLKKSEKQLNLNDVNVKGYYNILNDNKEILKLDNKEVYLILRYEHNEIASLNKPENHIGSTNINSYKSYTKAQSYFIEIEGDGNEEEAKKDESTNQKVLAIANKMRQQIRSLNGIIGVKTQKSKAIGYAVIVARCSKDWNEWSPLPEFLKKCGNQPNTDNEYIKGWYNIIENGNELKIDDKSVLLCVFMQDIAIDSLKTPTNKIGTVKK